MLLMTFTSNMVDGTRNTTSTMQVLVRASIACGRLSVLLTNFLALSPLFLRGNVMFSFSFYFILFFSFVLFFDPDEHSNALMIIQGKQERTSRGNVETIFELERIHVSSLDVTDRSLPPKRSRLCIAEIPMDIQESTVTRKTKKKSNRQGRSSCCLGYIQVRTGKKKGIWRKGKKSEQRVVCMCFFEDVALREAYIYSPSLACSCYEACMHG